jgi:hypothetical protein
MEMNASRSWTGATLTTALAMAPTFRDFGHSLQIPREEVRVGAGVRPDVSPTDASGEDARHGEGEDAVEDLLCSARDHEVGVLKCRRTRASRDFWIFFEGSARERPKAFGLGFLFFFVYTLI